MKRIATIAAFALIEEAAVIWMLHTGRDLIWKAQVAARVRRTQGQLDDRRRIS